MYRGSALALLLLPCLMPFTTETWSVAMYVVFLSVLYGFFDFVNS